MPSLKPFNTFGVEASCPALHPITRIDDLWSYLHQKPPEQRSLVLGGGSNVLLRDHLPYPVLLNQIQGRHLVSEDAASVIIELGSGENWHQIVEWSIAQGWNGLENLALIPGTVGAAPIQNIGAYGAEFATVFVDLEAIDLTTKELRHFDAAAAAFGYRDSCFKRSWKDRLFITKVRLRLSKTPQPNLSYGVLAKVLAAASIHQPTARDIANAVILIRSSKLPAPHQYGNAGSFFKNPTLPADWVAQHLQSRHPEVVVYPDQPGMVKIPAAWLIEASGWKGVRKGKVGSYPLQPLVLVNYGGATGTAIWEFAQAIQAAVQAKFGITLEPEVNLLP